MLQYQNPNFLPTKHTLTRTVRQLRQARAWTQPWSMDRHQHITGKLPESPEPNAPRQAREQSKRGRTRTPIPTGAHHFSGDRQERVGRHGLEAGFPSRVRNPRRQRRRHGSARPPCAGRNGKNGRSLPVPGLGGRRCVAAAEDRTGSTWRRLRAGLGARSAGRGSSPPPGS